MSFHYVVTKLTKTTHEHTDGETHEENEQAETAVDTTSYTLNIEATK